MLLSYDCLESKKYLKATFNPSLLVSVCEEHRNALSTLNSPVSATDCREPTLSCLAVDSLKLLSGYSQFKSCDSILQWGGG